MTYSINCYSKKVVYMTTVSNLQQPYDAMVTTHYIAKVVRVVVVTITFLQCTGMC